MGVLCPKKSPYTGLCLVTNPPCCVLTETLESDFFSHLVVIVNGVVVFLLCFVLLFFSKSMVTCNEVR